MRNIFLLVLIMTGFLQTAKGQLPVKQVDLEATLVTPLPGSSHYQGSPFPIKTIIRNLGPDTLFAGDTLAIAYPVGGNYLNFNYPGISGSSFHVNFVQLNPGDTIEHVLPIPQLTFASQMAGALNFCVQIGTNSNFDGSLGNNTSCHNIIFIDSTFIPPAPLLNQIFPAEGGNAGRTPVTIYGAWFDSTTLVRLTKTGAADIIVPDSLISVSYKGTVMNMDLDLFNRDTGLWNLVVTIPGDTVMKLPDVFRIIPMHVNGIVPAKGGNTGLVTASIIGYGLPGRAEIKLARTGYADIVVPDSLITMSHSAAGRVISATFDLRNRETGNWDLVVSAPGGPANTLTSGFLIEAGNKLCPTISVTGAAAARVGTNIPYYIQVSNPSNVDVDDIVVHYTTTHDQFYFSHYDTLPLPHIVPSDSFDGRHVPEGKAGMLLVRNIPAGGMKLIAADAITSGTPAAHRVVTVGVSCPPSTTETETDECLARLLNTLPGVTAPAAPGCVLSRLDQQKGANAEPLRNYGAMLLDAACACLGLTPTPALYQEIIRKMTQSAAASYGDKVCGEIIAIHHNATTTTDVLWSYDPNDKTGPSGTGTGHHIRPEDRNFPYLINFENDTSAAAAAQIVRVVDTLDKNAFDLTTFRLGAVKVGDTLIQLPGDLKTYTGYVDFRKRGRDYILEIKAGLDMNTGIATWVFTTLDPETMVLTTDPYAGFLPPNETSPEGQGSIFFDIKLKEHLPHGTTIKNRAYIYFDINAPIITNTWSNYIDTVQPAGVLPEIPGKAPGIMIYPNPSDHIFTIDGRYLPREEVTISIFNMQGQAVRRETIRFADNNFRYRLDMSGLSPAHYMVLLQSGEWHYAEKIRKL